MMNNMVRRFVKSKDAKILALLLVAAVPASQLGSSAHNRQLAAQPVAESSQSVTLETTKRPTSTPANKTVISHPSSQVVVDRLSGQDVFDTAVSVSQKYYQPGTAVAYIAERSAYPDAIVAGTTKTRGPLLYTKTTSLPNSIAQELKRLRPKQVTIVGGKDVVSSKVYSQVLSATPNSKVIRLSGASRYATAVDVSRSQYVSADTVYISNGSAYADAIAATQQQAAGPLLYVRQDLAPSVTINEIKRLQAKQVVILGGPDVVASKVASQITSQTSAKTKRISGPDRYATAARLSKQLYPQGIDQVYVSAGMAIADSIVISSIPKAGALLYSRTDNIPGSSMNEIYRLGASKITVVGGEIRVSKAVQNQLYQVARGAQLNHRIDQGLSYFISAHPDDELSAWAQIQRSPYPIFILASQGEASKYCEALGGRGSQKCKDARVASWHQFLDNYYAVSDHGQQSGGFHLYKGSDSARLVFDLGDGKITKSKITTAIAKARAVDYGISQENYLVSVNYWDNKRNPRCDPKLNDMACGLYAHADHLATNQAVADYTSFPNRLTIHGQYNGRTNTGMPISGFSDLIDCKKGSFNLAYSWLNPPCWTTKNSHFHSWVWAKEY